MEREPPDRLIGGPPSVSQCFCRKHARGGSLCRSWSGTLGFASDGPVGRQPTGFFSGFYLHRTIWRTQLLLPVV